MSTTRGETATQTISAISLLAGFCAKMSTIQTVKAFVNQRLTAAVEEIFELLETTISNYEEEIFRQRRLLDDVPRPENDINTAGVQKLIVKKDDQHEGRNSLDHKDPQLQHIKEEEEELWSSKKREELQGQEGDDTMKFTFTVKSEDYEEKTQLHPKQAEESREAAILPSSSAEQLETETDSSRQLLSLQSCDSETEDSDDYWKETGEQEAGSDSRVKRIRFKNKERPFSCTLCGKSFGIKGNLHAHMRSHTGEKPFSCTVCNRSFSSNDNMKRHMRSHTGEKPFSCSVCNRSFGQKKALVAHLRIHTGERPYSCSMCDKSFSQKITLITHLRCHTGEKPYGCSICGRFFSHQASLKAHIRVHTGEKPYSCSVCGRSFNVLGNCKSHKCTGVKSNK